jgi:DNA repair protein RadA/Sms
VLEQHAELRLADRDIFASSVGGIRVVEPASDLSLLLAIAGAHYKRKLEPGTAVIGEVGLGGEVRMVSQLEMRISESARLGFKRIVCPKLPKGTIKAPPGVMVDVVATVGQAIERLQR